MNSSYRIFKVTLSLVPVVVFVALIEAGRMAQFAFPVPFLSLFAATAFAGGFGGLKAGTIAGILSASFVIYAYSIGFGPKTLTGALPQTIIGSAVYIIAGFLLGRTKDERDRGLFDKTESLVEREKDLKKALEILQLAGEAGGIGTWVVDLKSGHATRDKTSIALHGLPEGSESCDYQSWADVIHPDDVKRLAQEYDAALAGTSQYDTEYRVVLPGGEIRHLKGDAMVVRDEQGTAVRIVGMNYNISKLRQKEAELLRTQRIASQAQKMDTIGQLTGGIAHDFNNLLAVIQGNLERLQDEEAQDDPSVGSERDEIILSAIAAAKRGGDLTKKMLAFARKSSLEPTVLDINTIVQETERWLSRTIPSNIEIETVLQSRCWRASLDSTNLQSAIVNTVVNARDSMPDGGKITIETSNLGVDQSQVEEIEEDVLPGRYVMLAVTDTGAGIQATDLVRIFDPFFTTKEIEFGTGLGLSMVQGFIKQSRGFVRVYSEVGVGTSIKMYFPATQADTTVNMAESVETEDRENRDYQPRILVVDDQIEILDILQSTFVSKGYSVETAVSGDQALEVFRKSQPFDLLVTDITMPGEVQGPELASRLRQVDKSLPAIFLSGYASEANVHGHDVQVEDIRLMKPVSRIELLQAVEKALRARRRNDLEQ